MDPNRIARNIAAGIVASIAAWSSYSHMVHVALRCGERAEVAYALPGSVDGMLIVASMVMVDDRRRHRPVRRTARVSFAVGVAASIAANVAAAHPGLPARLVAAWPAAALLLVVEMLTHRGTSDGARSVRGSGTGDATELPAGDHPRTAEAHAAAGITQPSPTSAGRHTDRAATPPGHDPARHVRPARPAASPPAPPVPMPLPSMRNLPTSPPETPPAADARHGAVPARARRRPSEEVRRLALQQQAAEPGLSQTELARRVGVSRRRLREILATGSDPTSPPPLAGARAEPAGSPSPQLEWVNAIPGPPDPAQPRTATMMLGRGVADDATSARPAGAGCGKRGPGQRTRRTQ